MQYDWLGGSESNFPVLEITPKERAHPSLQFSFNVGGKKHLPQPIGNGRPSDIACTFAGSDDRFSLAPNEGSDTDTGTDADVVAETSVTHQLPDSVQSVRGRCLSGRVNRAPVDDLVDVFIDGLALPPWAASDVDGWGCNPNSDPIREGQNDSSIRSFAIIRGTAGVDLKERFARSPDEDGTRRTVLFGFGGTEEVPRLNERVSLELAREITCVNEI